MRLNRSVLTAAVIFAALICWSEGVNGEDRGKDVEESKTDSIAVDRFKPTWESSVRGGDTEISVGSMLRTLIDPGRGWLISNTLKIEKKTYRGRPVDQIIENFRNTASRSESGLYAFTFNVGESYTRRTTLGIARYGKNIVYDNENASFNFRFNKPLLKAASSEIAASGDALRGTKDFKYDRTISGSMSGSLTYRIGDVFKVRGGVGTNRKRESSEISYIKFKRMPSHADTFLVGVDYGKGDKKLIEFAYQRMEGIERKVVPPRGNSFQVLDNPEDALEEKARKNSERITMNSFVEPFSFLGISFIFKHTLSSQENSVDKRLSKDSESTSLAAAATYRYSEKGNVSVNIENAESELDYPEGPLALSSNTQREKKASISISQDITDSLSVKLRGSTSLRQQFYRERETNPRDVDYLTYRFDFDMTASPFPRIDTAVTITADRMERINIDRTLSGDNRIEYLYRVAPKISLKPATWLRLSQEYNIRIEHTDFVYKNEKDFLNRTTTLSTMANFNIFRPLRFNFTHTYLFKDSGSYLERSGERRYNRSGEIIDNGLLMRMQYQPKSGFGLIAEADFRNQENKRLGFREERKVVTSSTLYESGGIKLGFMRKRNIGDTGKIDFDIAYVKRFGANISEEKREYWEVDASMTFNF